MKIHHALIALFPILLTACASDPHDTVARADTKKARECSESIGSSICRRDDSGVKAPSNVISGDDLRRSGTITGAQPGVISN